MDELEGREFDWFAVDENGEIAVFSTAGNGTVPESVKENYKAHDSISEKFEYPNWGSDNVWKDFANYGLFVFDWRLNNGPYVKKSAPNGKIDSELKSKILKISGIPKLQMDFSKVDKTEL